MDTAQAVLTEGNQTAQVQAVTSTIPWIVFAVVVVVVAMIFLNKRK
ncbi:MAG: hypothetical protein WBN22_01050 [Verrucomicrobiia bacterium]